MWVLSVQCFSTCILNTFRSKRSVSGNLDEVEDDIYFVNLGSWSLAWTKMLKFSEPWHCHLHNKDGNLDP
jgi:hypothetical protein